MEPKRRKRPGLNRSASKRVAYLNGDATRRLRAAMATDEELTSALVGESDLTPRELLEKIVAGSADASMRLWKSTDPEAASIDGAFDGFDRRRDWRWTFVFGLLLRAILEDFPRNSTVLMSLARQLEIAARELARAEEWRAA